MFTAKLHGRVPLLAVGTGAVSARCGVKTLHKELSKILTATVYAALARDVIEIKEVHSGSGM